MNYNMLNYMKCVMSVYFIKIRSLSTGTSDFTTRRSLVCVFFEF